MSTTTSDIFARPIALPETRAWRVYSGGRLLEEFRGHASAADGHFPEDWLGSTVAARNPDPKPGEGLTVVTLPDGRAVPLGDLIAQHPVEALGAERVAAFGPRLGMLVKLLDSAVRLPIQCHPSADYARTHYGSDFGKTESWLILDTRETNGIRPFVYLGFKQSAREDAWRRAVHNADTPALESMLLRHEVSAGEVYHVPPGVPHAIGPGVFMVEVQEPTDITITAERRCVDVKIEDAQRFAGASEEAALGAFDYTTIPKTDAERTRPTRAKVIQYGGDGLVELLIGASHTPCYRAWRARVAHGALPAIASNSAQVVVATAGHGVIFGGGLDARPNWEFPIQRGEAAFIPHASAPRFYQSENRLELIVCAPGAPTKKDG